MKTIKKSELAEYPNSLHCSAVPRVLEFSGISIGIEIQDSPQLIKEESLAIETVENDHRQHQPRVEYFIEEEHEEFDECEEPQKSEMQANSPAMALQPIRRSIRRSIPVYPAKSQPPSKGRKRQDQEEVEKVFVDSALYEFAAPQTLDNRIVASTSKAGRRLQMSATDFRRGLEEEEVAEPKPARNLDWIIDAVAEGKSVDKASPHSRRQATFHTCEHCGLELKYPSKIAAHMRTHTKEKPFKCEICAASFAQNTTLRMHLRRHLDQKPYHCPDAQCGQRFINGGLLNAHIQKRHMQPRRFACLNGCGKIFTSNAERQKHEQHGCHTLKFQYAYEEVSGENGEMELEDDSHHQPQHHYQPSQMEAESYDETYYY
uniref:C2H2-type domain-containing protein n=1 Tax=Ditylenchus dipsaci TaxID=166011 RepID=A0A915DUM1_9BILA